MCEKRSLKTKEGQMYYDMGYIRNLYFKELKEYIFWVVAVKEKYDSEKLNEDNIRNFFKNFPREVLKEVERRNIRLGGMHYVLGVSDETLMYFLQKIDINVENINFVFSAFLDRGTVVFPKTKASPEAIALSEALE